MKRVSDSYYYRGTDASFPENIAGERSLYFFDRQNCLEDEINLAEGRCETIKVDDSAKSISFMDMKEKHQHKIDERIRRVVDSWSKAISEERDEDRLRIMKEEAQKSIQSLEDMKMHPIMRCFSSELYEEPESNPYHTRRDTMKMQFKNDMK